MEEMSFLSTKSTFLWFLWAVILRLLAIAELVLAIVVTVNVVKKLIKTVKELKALDASTEEHCESIKKLGSIVKEKKFWKKRTVLSVVLFAAADLLLMLVLNRYIFKSYRVLQYWKGFSILALIPLVFFGAYIVVNLLRRQNEADLAVEICDDDELGTDENDDSDDKDNDNDGVEENLTEIDDKKDSAPSSENQSLGFGDGTF